jgi:orotidine-5'-phosphate decarboxylase
MLINASRSIMYAGSGPNFAEAARAEALRLRDAINAAIEPAPGSQQQL